MSHLLSLPKASCVRVTLCMRVPVCVCGGGGSIYFKMSSILMLISSPLFGVEGHSLVTVTCCDALLVKASRDNFNELTWFICHCLRPRIVGVEWMWVRGVGWGLTITAGRDEFNGDCLLSDNCCSYTNVSKEREFGIALHVSREVVSVCW